MLGAFLLTAVLVAVCVSVVWPSVRRAVKEAGHEPLHRRPAPAASAEPGTLEGKLTLELVRGEITGRQYRQAMEAVAGRDSERNPLDVPPDIASPGPG
jgi:hypothetical protein